MVKSKFQFSIFNFLKKSLLVGANSFLFKLFVLCTLYFVLCTKILLSQKKYTITFVENTNTPTFNQKKYNSLRFDSLNVYSELNKLAGIERNKGYVAANFDSILFDSSQVFAYFNRGKQFFIRKIDFTAEDEFILKQLSIKSLNNTVFTEKKIENLQNQILSYFENIGYPFVYTEINKLTFLNDSIDISLKINKSDYIVFDSVLVQSESKISSKFLRKYIGIKENKPYSEKAFRDIDNKINELDFISLQRLPEIEFTKGKADVYLYLKKKESNKISGIIGILPPAKETDKIIITGDLNLYLQNMFAHGEFLSLQWQKYDALSQKLKTQFDFPFIFNQALGLNTSFNLQKQDTTYLNVRLKSGIQYYYKNTNYLKVFYENTSSVLLQKQNEQERNLSEYQFKGFGVGIYHSKLDYKQNPRKGLHFSADFSSGKKHLSSDSSSVQYHFESDFSLFLPVFKHFTFRFQNLLGWIENEQIFQNELFRLGGLMSLKGFDDESIFSSAYSVFNAELRFLFEENSNFYVFYNQAYYEQKLSLKTISDTPSGFGAGLNFQTKAGVFSLVYALGKQINSPLNIKNAKVHFGYISRF